jgi:hypothetical protein
VDLDVHEETIRRDLFVGHIGFARDELRVVLASPSGDPSLVVELKGVHSFFDRGAANCGPVVVDISEPGSFGWHFSAEDRARHSEVRINAKGDLSTNLFRAIARSVRTRTGESEDRNFPG